MLVRFFAALLCGPVLLVAAQAQGSLNLCTKAPRSYWMSWQEIETKLIEQGRRMVRLRIAEDRCLAVLSMDARGDYREMRMDPVDGRILESAAVPEPRSTGLVPWRAKQPGS